MKSSIQIPYFPKEQYDSEHSLIEALERQGAHLFIDTINWAEYSYCPLVSLQLAYTDSTLILHYFVRGLDLRTLSPEDGNYVHTDSCVEFFMQKEQGESYTNFEFNAAGVCYASHHSTIRESTPLTSEEYASIKRSGTHIGEKHSAEGVHSWELLIEIPWSTMGYTDGPPERLWGNFYKCGDETAHPHFLSWAPIDAPSPAFHRPQFFGELVLLPRD